MSVTATTEGAQQTLAQEAKVWRQALAFAQTLLLSIWLGSMIFFSFAVAPSAFAVLPTRELAGALITSTIGKVEVLGLVIGPLLILIHAASWRFNRSSRSSKIIQLVLVVVMTAAAALSHFWISPTMISVRIAMGGPIDEVAMNDPVRVWFNNLHQYSVALMGTAMIAGLAVLFLAVRSWLKR